MKELKDWIEARRIDALNKMAANVDNPAIKNYYEGVSDDCMATLIYMAVHDKTN
jgi:hypothetical protein